MDPERDDYADPDLPPERPPSWITVGLIGAIVLFLAVTVGLPLLAGFVAARMAWN